MSTATTLGMSGAAINHTLLYCLVLGAFLLLTAPATTRMKEV